MSEEEKTEEQIPEEFKKEIREIIAKIEQRVVEGVNKFLDEAVKREEKAPLEIIIKDDDTKKLLAFCAYTFGRGPGIKGEYEMSKLVKTLSDLGIISPDEPKE